MSALSVEDLLSINDGGVTQRIHTRFLDFLKAVPEVRSTFFSGEPAPVPFPGTVFNIRPLDAGWGKRIAIAVACAAVPRLVVRNFNQLIDEGRVRGFLDRELAPSSPAAIAAGEAIYDAEFGGYATTASGNCFQSYLVDRNTAWGSELADAVTHPAFRTKTDIQIKVGTPEERISLQRRLTRIVYMVGRLDPGRRDDVSRAFASWYPQIYDTTTSSRLIRSDYQDRTFFDAVSASASIRRHVSQGPGIVRMHSAPPPLNYQWGENFRDFLDAHASEFRTGVRPDYWETVTIFSCFTRGTPVHLPNGKVRAIEAVDAGDTVLSSGGAIATRAAEDSERVLDKPMKIHGFNDIAPFVSPAHILLTPTGPKAIDPISARTLNPDIPVEELKVGDTLLRLSSTSPFLLEQVPIARISDSWLEAGESLFALVLSGEQSYFANGFLVAANYPTLTEERIAHGILALSFEERAELLRLLQPVVPLLLSMLRGFAGPQLTAILTSQPSEEPTV